MPSRPQRQNVFILFVCASLGACAPAAVAQSPAPAPSQQLSATAPPAQIQTSATEYVEIAPDRAMISFSVETRGRTAAAAGAENARIQAAALDTLRRLGIASKDIRTTGVSVMPEYEYPRDGGRPTVVGYQARNTIQVELAAEGQLGATIDAALAKGVTNVGGLHFFAENTAEARREAIRKAVARARSDAEAIAAAAGGTLGMLIEISANSEAPEVRPFTAGTMMARAQADASTPVEPGEVRVTAFVSAKFAFVPGR